MKVMVWLAFLIVIVQLGKLGIATGIGLGEVGMSSTMEPPVIAPPETVIVAEVGHMKPIPFAFWMLGLEGLNAGQ